MQTLTLEQFRATVAAGGVLSVTLQAQGGAFAVQIETRRGEAILVTSRQRAVRFFIDPRKALLLLRELGIRKVHLNAEAWQPEQADALRPARPDRAAQMKAAHAAARETR